MTSDLGEDLSRAMSQIPSGLFVLTTAHDGDRSGVLVRWIQQCSVDPPMVMVALPKGEVVEPLIRDSRAFALCQIQDDDRLLPRKFAVPPDRGDDPFVSMNVRCAPSGSPVPDRVLSFLDCELVCHVDLEADHRLFIGRVMHGEMLNGSDSIDVQGNGHAAE